MSFYKTQYKLYLSIKIKDKMQKGLVLNSCRGLHDFLLIPKFRIYMSFYETHLKMISIKIKSKKECNKSCNNENCKLVLDTSKKPIRIQ